MTEYPRLVCRKIDGEWIPVSESPSEHTRHGNGIDIGNPAVRDAVKKLIKRYVS